MTQNPSAGPEGTIEPHSRYSMGHRWEVLDSILEADEDTAAQLRLTEELGIEVGSAVRDTRHGLLGAAVLRLNYDVTGQSIEDITGERVTNLLREDALPEELEALISARSTELLSDLEKTQLLELDLVSKSPEETRASIRDLFGFEGVQKAIRSLPDHLKHSLMFAYAGIVPRQTESAYIGSDDEPGWWEQALEHVRERILIPPVPFYGAEVGDGIKVAVFDEATNAGRMLGRRARISCMEGRVRKRH